jgi:hypothetical protein
MRVFYPHPAMSMASTFRVRDQETLLTSSLVQAISGDQEPVTKWSERANNASYVHSPFCYGF